MLSSDRNITERVWDDLVREKQKMQPTPKTELWRGGKNTTLDFFEKLSLLKRMKGIMKVGHIKHKHIIIYLVVEVSVYFFC